MAVQYIEGRHATVDELALAHDPRYIAGLHALISGLGAEPRVASGSGPASGSGSGPGSRSASGPGLARLGSDTIVSPGSWDAATAAAGCVLDGVDMAIDGRAVRSFAAVRPPGHHALADEAMGFCLFGNVALGAHYARARHGLERVLIVDWDVHHGNGTQALVEQDPAIRFVSMHQWPWYPGTGAATDHGPHGSVWNVPMAARQAPDVYMDALLRAVDAATARWTPDLVLISAGFDCLRGDPLGGFTLELEHVTTLTRAMVDRATGWCGGRLVSALEGGYAPQRVGAGCVAHLRALMPVSTPPLT
jgi:acetoin utilization deacetylase AcuC-like enzyme